MAGHGYASNAGVSNNLTVSAKAKLKDNSKAKAAEPSRHKILLATVPEEDYAEANCPKAVLATVPDEDDAEGPGFQGVSAIQQAAPQPLQMSVAARGAWIEEEMNSDDMCCPVTLVSCQSKRYACVAVVSRVCAYCSVRHAVLGWVKLGLACTSCCRPVGLICFLLLKQSLHVIKHAVLIHAVCLALCAKLLDVDGS